MLDAYLVVAGQAGARPWPGVVVRGWVVFTDLIGGKLALAGAAGYWRAGLEWDAPGGAGSP